jgi:hypothetical protein
MTVWSINNNLYAEKLDATELQHVSRAIDCPKEISYFILKY